MKTQLNVSGEPRHVKRLVNELHRFNLNAFNNKELLYDDNGEIIGQVAATYKSISQNTFFITIQALGD